MYVCLAVTIPHQIDARPAQPGALSTIYVCKRFNLSRSAVSKTFCSAKVGERDPKSHLRHFQKLSSTKSNTKSGFTNNDGTPAKLYTHPCVKHSEFKF